MKNQWKSSISKTVRAKRFEPALSAKGRGRTERHELLERLKERLVAERLEQTWADRQDAVQIAANEAAALAWLTPFPALFFPALFEEQTQAALAVADRQEEVRRTSRELLAV